MTTDDKAAPRRPFRIGDALLLVAAAAVAFALVRSWTRPTWASFLVYFQMGNQAINPVRQLNYNISYGISRTIPFGIMFSLFVIVARLRSPRPPLKTIVQQPGTVACIAAIFPVAFHVVDESLTWILAYLTRPQSLIHLPSPPFTRFDNPGFHPPVEKWILSVLLQSFPVLVAPSVLAATVVSWSILKLGGTWRPEPNWIDRFGRFLGIYWIITCIVITILTKVWMFLA